jgi:uncharacterized protein YndB with AHSA1/START domain
MRSFTYTEHIERTPEQVFAFMMDFPQAPRWRSLVRRIEVIGGEPVRQGSEVLLTIDVMGKTRQVVSEIWSYDPPRRLGFRNTADNITGQFEYVLSAENSGTRVRMTCDICPRGLMWLLIPWIRRSHRARYSDQLARLKAAMEHPA